MAAPNWFAPTSDLLRRLASMGLDTLTLVGPWKALSMHATQPHFCSAPRFLSVFMQRIPARLTITTGRHRSQACIYLRRPVCQMTLRTSRGQPHQRLPRRPSLPTVGARAYVDLGQRAKYDY